ncbi:MAG: ATP-dependent sacrificial sulfur transferase LarE [Candidatus Omnitrophota bacterium]|jgi:uncharacterized protein
MTFQHKLACLKRKIYGYKSCVVAFSGGQDSALLLKLCSLVLPKANILAATAVSATYPKDELRKAKILAKEIGTKLRVIKTAELDNKEFTANSASRCYFCKKELFLKLIVIARKKNFDFVLDASNVSDKSDYRPGNVAKKELGIRSPLLEAGFAKKDIRKLSKMLGLSSWNKPPLACLASRIPYGTKITAGLLRRIDQAEAYLVSLGFRLVRLRHYNGLCRIEVEKKHINRLLRNRRAIVDKLKSLGYTYITLDLEGYRTGSLNEVIKR